MSPPIFIHSAIADFWRGWPPPVLDPAGPNASATALLTWALFGMAALVLVVVGVALYVALFGKPALRRRLGGTAVIWGAGIAFPVVVLTALLVWGLTLTSSLSDPAPRDALKVRVAGQMWWWRVAYLDDQGQVAVRDANELHIPVGRPVELQLTSYDVIHNFWVPRLSGKLDMIPGRVNTMRIQADEPGVFGGVCAEFCGGPHALMGFVVVAHPPAEFDRMMADRMRSDPVRLTAEQQRGERLFLTAGCAACHRIQGTPYNGAAGPDLTYVATRRTIGAGILQNNRGTLMGWIGNSQAIKPGNRMPPYAMLSGEDLKAIAVYLEAKR